MAKFRCWAGDKIEEYGFDAEEIEARHMDDAARAFAVCHDEGEDSCTVFVADPDDAGCVVEYDLWYTREVHANIRTTKTHIIAPDEDE